MKQAYICENIYINYLISESKKLKMSSDLNESITSSKKKGRAPGSKKMDCLICDQHFFKVENYEKHIAEHQAKGEFHSQPSQDDGDISHSLLAAEQSTQSSQEDGFNTAEFDNNLSPSRRSTQVEHDKRKRGSLSDSDSDEESSKTKKVHLNVSDSIMVDNEIEERRQRLAALTGPGPSHVDTNGINPGGEVPTPPTPISQMDLDTSKEHPTEIAQTNEFLAKLQEELNTKTKTLEDTIQRHDAVKSQYQEANIKLEKMEEMIESKNSEVESLKNKIKEKNIKIKQANEDAKSWEAHCTKLRESKGHPQLDESQKDKKIRTQAEKIKELEEERDHLKENFTNASNLNVQLQRHISTLKEENDILTKRFKKCTDPGCMDDKACRFSHHHKNQKHIPCHHYLKGFCKHEEKCLWRHDPKDRQKDLSTESMETDGDDDVVEVLEKKDKKSQGVLLARERERRKMIVEEEERTKKDKKKKKKTKPGKKGNEEGVQIGNLNEDQLRELQKQLNALPSAAKGAPSMPPPFSHHGTSAPASTSSAGPSSTGTPSAYGAPYVPLPPAMFPTMPPSMPPTMPPAMPPVLMQQFTAPPEFMTTPRDPLEANNDFGCVPIHQNHQDFRRPGPELQSNSSGPRSNVMAQGQRNPPDMMMASYDPTLDPRINQHQAYQREPKNHALSRIKTEASQAELQMAQMKANWTMDHQKVQLDQQMRRQQMENAQKYAQMFLNKQATNLHGPNQQNMN